MGLAVTASFVVAQHEENDNIGVVIKRADSELYSAKAAGRHRVHSYGIENLDAVDKSMQPAQTD